MKVFISWSGKRSRIIAETLNSWLPNVIQSIETFYSPEIEKGTKGGAEINATLEGTSFGIICLTPDNLKSEWIHYEAGALAKINDKNTRVWTLLNGLDHSDVEQPLAQFQHTLTEKEDFYRLLESINKHLEKPLTQTSLRKTFEIWWLELEESFNKAEKATNKKQEKDNQGVENIRSEREILNEILEILRAQQRNFPDDLLTSLQRRNDLEHIYPKTINRVSFKLRILGKSSYLSMEEIENKLQQYFPASDMEINKTNSGHIYNLTFIPYLNSAVFFQIAEKFEIDNGLHVELIGTPD